MASMKQSLTQSCFFAKDQQSSLSLNRQKQMTTYSSFTHNFQTYFLQSQKALFCCFSSGICSQLFFQFSAGFLLSPSHTLHLSYYFLASVFSPSVQDTLPILTTVCTLPGATVPAVVAFLAFSYHYSTQPSHGSLHFSPEKVE